MSKYSRVRTFRDPLGQSPLKSPVTPATLLLNFLSPPGVYSDPLLTPAMLPGLGNIVATNRL